jgi:hypothetical protein
MTVKALQDGEFGVSLEDDLQPNKFTGSEEIEVFSTWVKSKFTRVSLDSNIKMRRALRDLAFDEIIDLSTCGVGGQDYRVRNDVDDLVIKALWKKGIITKSLYDYCLSNQVDEIIFLTKWS